MVNGKIKVLFKIDMYYIPDIVDVRSFIVLILVVWRNKNKIKVCLIIFAFDVSRVRCHVSPS